MYNLSNDGIKQACGAAESFLAENKIEHRETVRILLLIEEMLLKYKAVFGDGQEYELKTRRTLGRTSISIRLPGIGSDLLLCHDGPAGAAFRRDRYCACDQCDC